MEPNILMATKQWTLVQPLVSAFVGAIVRDFAVRDDLLQEIAVAILESYERMTRRNHFSPGHWDRTQQGSGLSETKRA